MISIHQDENSPDRVGADFTGAQGVCRLLVNQCFDISRENSTKLVETGLNGGMGEGAPVDLLDPGSGNSTPQRGGGLYIARHS